MREQIEAKDHRAGHCPKCESVEVEEIRKIGGYTNLQVEYICMDCNTLHWVDFNPVFVNWET